MPYSFPAGKDIIKKWFDKQKDIKTIVDVGPGAGAYAKLLGKKYKYIGIEIWAPYIEQFNLHELYDKIIIGNIKYVNLPSADVVILGDILEHLNKEDARAVLRKAEKRYKHVVVSIPVGEFNQGSFQGNKYETHLSSWTFEELGNIMLNYKVKELRKNIAIFIK